MTAMDHGIDQGMDQGIDPKALRFCLGQFPTGVCIVTARDGDEPLGMTMSSFNSLSLDPPLVLFSVDRKARGLPAWERAEGYAIHILAEGQTDLSNRFARQGANKWEGLPYEPGLAGAPLLAGAAAVLECARDRLVEAGDHILFIAAVRTIRTEVNRKPLIFCKGRYGKLHEDAGSEAALWPLDIHY